MSEIGTNKSDMIDGGTGDDVINAGNGNDLVNGGDGNDDIDGGNGADVLNGDAGDDLLAGGNGNDTINGGIGDDELLGQSGDDVLTGGDGNDIIDGGSGRDTAIYLRELAGYRFTRLSDGTILVVDIDSGETDEVRNVEWFVFDGVSFSADSLPDVVPNDQGGVDIEVNNAAALSASVGTDGVDNVTYSGTDDVVLPATIENITLQGTADVSVTGNTGNNTIIGNAGDNAIESGGGDDFIESGDGNDLVDAGTGDDTIVGGSGAGDDIYIGGSGVDLVSYASTSLGVVVNLGAGTASGPEIGNDTLTGIERVRGGAGNDTFIATGFNTGDPGPGVSSVFNEFEGLAGSDTIVGNGSTRISFLSATGGVTVDLAAGSATGNASVDTDTFTGVRSVRGSNFGDTIFGSDNPAGATENFEGRGGNDFIDGRGGVDRVQYNFDATNTGIRVNMANGIVVGDAAIGTDTLRSIEHMRGTDFADVYVASGFGTAGANVGNNGTGNEFEGEGGDDFITGNGSTRVSYLHALAGVTVDIAAGTGQGTAAGDVAQVGIDSFTEVNAVRGSTFDDILLGSDTAQGSLQFFEGFAGDDFINGRGGFDIARYDNAVDPVTGLGIHVDLASGIVTGRDAAAAAMFGTDTLRRVEGVRGSDADDVYDASGFSDSSTNAGDTLPGGTRNEFEGMSGNDSITGNGNTRISYTSALAGVTVDLAAGTAAGTAAGDLAGVGTDTVVSGVNAVRGSNFNDAFRGTGNSETFEGQDGVDRVLYNNATGPITVNLAAGTVTGSGVGTDSLRSIEFVGGSGSGDTYIATNFGTSGANVGSNGSFNEFEGRGGSDIITGNGNTRVSYLNAAAGVTVNMSTTIAGSGTAIGTDGIDTAGVGSDAFTGVSSVRGSNFADQIFGSNNANQTNEIFEGRGGNDLINGRGGFDTAAYEVDAATTTGISVVASGGGLNWTVTGDSTVGTDTLTAVEAIRGTDFADTFNAMGFNGASTDVIANGPTFNEFEGNGGNDIIIGNGNTRLTFVNATGGVVVNLATGTASGDTSVGSDTFSGVSRARGSTFDDRIGGSSGDDILDGREGSDVVSYLAAAAGVTVSLGITAAQNTGGAGSDALSNFEDLIGSNHNDSLTGTAGDNVLTGAGGNDSIFGNGGRDIAAFSGNFADYTVTGFTSVVDNVAGRDGTDSLNGIAILEFADRYVLNQDTSSVALTLNQLGFAPGKSFHGTAGNDSISHGTNSNLRLFDLGDGSDTITYSAGGTYLSNYLNVEFINGSSGADALYLQNVASGVAINLFGDTDALTLANGANNVTVTGVETVTGGSGNDQIVVSNLAGALTTITGGLGADAITASAGIETFRYAAVVESVGASTDTISGFTEGQDLFDFTAIDANTNTANDQAFTFLENATPGTNPGVVANSVTWFQSGGNTIVQADNTGDNIADLTITLTGLKNLDASDFLL